MDIDALNESWSDSDNEEHIDAFSKENQEVSSMAQMGISVKTALDHPSSVENVLCWVCVENSS
jgi:hypothetical protein